MISQGYLPPLEIVPSTAISVEVFEPVDDSSNPFSPGLRVKTLC